MAHRSVTQSSAARVHRNVPSSALLIRRQVSMRVTVERASPSSYGGPWPTCLPATRYGKGGLKPTLRAVARLETEGERCLYSSRNIHAILLCWLETPLSKRYHHMVCKLLVRCLKDLEIARSSIHAHRVRHDYFSFNSLHEVRDGKDGRFTTQPPRRRVKLGARYLPCRRLPQIRVVADGYDRRILGRIR